MVNDVGFDLSELSYLVDEIASLSIVGCVVSFVWYLLEVNEAAHQCIGED